MQTYVMATEWLTIKQVSEELEIDYNRVLAWTKRKMDPLPARLIDGNKKQGRVFRPDLNEWIMRNSEILAETL